MIEFLILCLAIGIVIAIPVWIVSQRFGARRGLQAARGFNPDDAVTCLIEPVALKGRLMPDLDDTGDDGLDGKQEGAR